MNQVAKEQYTNLSYLLGGWQPQVDRNEKRTNGSNENWSPNKEMVKATIEFAQSTGRLAANLW